MRKCNTGLDINKYQELVQRINLKKIAKCATQDEEKRAQIIEKSLTREGDSRSHKESNSFSTRRYILGGILILGVTSSGAGPVVGAVVGGDWKQTFDILYLVPKKKKKKRFAGRHRGVGSSTQHR